MPSHTDLLAVRINRTMLGSNSLDGSRQALICRERSGRDDAEAYPGFGRQFGTVPNAWYRLCEIVIFSGATHHKLEVCIPVVQLNQCCHNMWGASSGNALSPQGITRGV
jgi:hypothetical protein